MNKFFKKIILALFYKLKKEKTCVFVCSKTKEYVNAGKYITGSKIFYFKKLPDCPHCGFKNINNPSYHYEIMHCYVLRPNFFGRLLLLDSIIISGVINK